MTLGETTRRRPIPPGDEGGSISPHWRVNPYASSISISPVIASDWQDSIGQINVIVND
jgi:hypothetical protein